ncbi:MAG: CvpA family protein [Gammaproteobacteria bacterium]|nr:CvpA family protein [Gammaproteobacteria bacterium]
MNWADIVILLIILISMLISIWRGFTREALSLGGWVVAFWLALTFSGKLAGLLTSFISMPSVRVIVSFVFLFVITLLLASWANYLISNLVKRTGLTGADRVFGVVFGALRGCVVVVILVLLAGLTPVPQDPWWDKSFFIEHFQDAAIWVRAILPDDVAQYIRYKK